jgi:hypothetical protein
MAKTFASDISKFAKKFGLTLDEAHRGIAIKLFTSVVMDTPVDSGALRGAWNISEGEPDESVNNSKDPSGSVLVARISSQVGRAGSVSVMTNPLPYAQVVEYGLYPTGSAHKANSKVTPQGFSKKAPAGMVRRNIARIQQIVREAVSKAKRKVK